VKEYHVLNLGAGVQSTALFLLARDPDPKVRFDLASFADTGEEPTAVYAHLEYLRALGSPEIWVRSAGSLGDDLIHGALNPAQFLRERFFAGFRVGVSPDLECQVYFYWGAKLLTEEKFTAAIRPLALCLATGCDPLERFLAEADLAIAQTLCRKVN